MHTVRAAAFTCLIAAGIMWVVSGCGRRAGDPGPSPASADPARPLTLVSFAVDGRAPPLLDAPASASAVEAAAHSLARISPDVLVLQYAHPAVPASAFVAGLAQAGLAYAHSEVVTSRQSRAALVLLSRHPVVTRRSESDPAYRIGDRQHHVDPGILDVDLVAGPHGLVRVVSGCLKDKVFHVSGQTEMRRNEARILGRRLRRAGSDTEGGGLVVAMVINDEPASAPVREFTEESNRGMAMIRAVDAAGDAWTTRDHEEDRYERTDYVFVNRALGARVDEEAARILDDSALRAVSGHRPLVIRFTPPEAGGTDG